MLWWSVHRQEQCWMTLVLIWDRSPNHRLRHPHRRRSLLVPTFVARGRRLLSSLQATTPSTLPTERSRQIAAQRPPPRSQARLNRLHLLSRSRLSSVGGCLLRLQIPRNLTKPHNLVFLPHDIARPRDGACYLALSCFQLPSHTYATPNWISLISHHLFPSRCVEF